MYIGTSPHALNDIWMNKTAKCPKWSLSELILITTYDLILNINRYSRRSWRLDRAAAARDSSMSLHRSLSTALVVLKCGWCRRSDCRAAAPFTLTKTMGAFCCSPCSSSCTCCAARRCFPPSRARPSCVPTGAGTGPSWTSATRLTSACRISTLCWRSMKLPLPQEFGSMLCGPGGILQGRFISSQRWCPP